MCEVNLLEVEIVYGSSKNQHSIRAEILKSGIEDFGTSNCKDCKGFAWIKYCWSVGQGWLLDWGLRIGWMGLRIFSHGKSGLCYCWRKTKSGTLWRKPRLFPQIQQFWWPSIRKMWKPKGCSWMLWRTIPYLMCPERKNSYEMWEALIKLYHSGNQNKKMVLREQLRSTKMSKSDIVVSYLTGISQAHDELTTIGEVVNDDELVRTTLNGFLE